MLSGGVCENGCILNLKEALKMTKQPTNAVVWTEIPVSDLKKAVAFYTDVFGYSLTIDESGPNPMAVFPDKDTMGACGHLYPGKPASNGQGPTAHLAIAGKVEDAAARCTKAGGKVLSPVITIPPGRYVYAQDPDGNSLGLFEAAS